MRFIKTYYTRSAYDKAVNDGFEINPYIAFIIDTGEVIYSNRIGFNIEDFNDDFDVAGNDDYLRYFKMYQEDQIP